MIDAAIETGEDETVTTVLDLAARTNPDEAETIAAVRADYLAAAAARAAAAKAEERVELRQAGFFELLEGEGEIGAFRSTGNTLESGVTAGIKLISEGTDWRHTIKLRGDYQRSDGETVREQLLASYQPHYGLSDDVFVYGLAQYEQQPFQGFPARYAASAGLGYRIADRDDLRFVVEGGPAFRYTRLTGGGSNSAVAAFAGLDFDWQLVNSIALTQEAQAFLESGNTTLTSLSGIELGLAEGIRARASYAIEYDRDPPPGGRSTDTLSRFTLIFGF